MSEGPRRWVKLLVPIAGLSVIPLVGLIYAATTTFAPGSEKKEPSASPSDSSAPGRTQPRANLPRSGVPRAAEAKICCEKLRELAQTSEVDQRATFLAAGAACDAADNDEQAFKQVTSICGGERVDIPSECKNVP